MKVQLRQVEPEDRNILERLLQLHLYEMGMEPGADGLVDWGESLDPFFSDPRFLALFLMEGQETIGVALAKLDYEMGDPVTGERITVNFIEEFFLSRPQRKKGLGTQAIDRILAEYPGRWVVTTWPCHHGAVRFWRHVAVGRADATGKEFPPDQHKGFPGQYVWFIRS